MARDAQDREDLLRDATAFHHRVELRFEGAYQAIPVVAGFRGEGALSVYFDQDPVYHFNTSGELRRAFVDGMLLKAESGGLVQLQRSTSTQETAMVRHELSQAEQQSFCQAMQRRLEQLHASLTEQGYELVGAVPSDEAGQIIADLLDWLGSKYPHNVAQLPNVVG